MQSDYRARFPLSIRLAHAINRLLTWGMTTPDRQRLLSEGLADWEAMAEDQRPRQVLGRAIRGIPAAIWFRLSDRDITSMPAGIALSLVGLGGIVSGSAASPYPEPFKLFVVVTSAGLLLVGVNFVRNPRRVILARYRPAGLLAAVGFTGLAVTFPTAAQWPYDGPVLENVVMDRAMQVSFVVIAIGFLLLIAASHVREGRRWVTTAGIVLVIGTATLGVTQIVWGVTMAPIDLTMSVPSLVIGLGALSFVHVLPRLRHLDIVYSEVKTGRLDQQGLRKGKS
ncbi:MAG: hypothetical protein QNJ77_03705 [Acidimicrobiia bacterium]|nr:hypothetical protein [Acidimicrobiia bacterium]